MTPELTALALAALLLLAQLGWMALRANLEVGSRYFLSPRDAPPTQLPSPGTMRLKRAYENHLEALPPFAVAVLVVTLSDAASPFTAACAWGYLAARALYAPAYLLGWVPWRSILFGIGYATSILMILAALT
ncbi:MAG: MAPEG family protein [Rhodobacteraceae bacterium]|nr:MAPEG family protein [Paracoccaceae bacterium]